MMSFLSTMTIVPIATQTPMNKFFGRIGCHMFWTGHMIYQWGMIMSGVGMAVYRLICFHFLFKRNLDNKSILRYILLTELALSVGLISMSAVSLNKFGWEKAVLFQFCMDIGSDKVEAIDRINQEQDNDLFFKILRFVPVALAQALVVVEFIIYIWIIFHLWKHDRQVHQSGVITEHMKKERNQKNVITLVGQIASFSVEIAFGIYTSIHVSNLSHIDSSVMPIFVIVGSTVISVVQICTSHEMKRFVASEFNLF